MQTNSQKMAHAAYTALLAAKPHDEFTSFAKGFPALIHTCGVAQAVLFALGKSARNDHHKSYLNVLCAVLQSVGATDAKDGKALEEKCRMAGLPEYLLLSRDALAAAGWIKRYAEAADADSGAADNAAPATQGGVK